MDYGWNFCDMSLHGMIGSSDNSHFLPLVYGFLTNKSQECYAKFFEAIKQYALELNISLNPKQIITDF